MVAHPGGARALGAARRLSAARRPSGTSRLTTARSLNRPRQVLVEDHADGTPRRVNRQGVAVIRDEWRIVDRWWTDEPVDRRYFDLVLETGENAVVFCDSAGGGWFTQRA